MTLERAYYHCPSCKEGFCPRDGAMGMASTSLSPAVTRMVGVVGSIGSFEQGSKLLHDLAGLDVETKHVERAAEELGCEIARDEKSLVEALPPGDSLPPTLYLGMDGTGIPMRPSELQGRSGKQPDGSAKTREVKLCSVWSAESRDAEGKPTRDPGSVSYSAAIESAAARDDDKEVSDFAQRVQREATRRGFDRASHRVVLGDGAAWIWNLADELFPDAIQIVDLFHAKEHLTLVAKAIWGPDSQLGIHWAERRHIELDAGDLDAILRALARKASDSEEARKCAHYFLHNRLRMSYPEFRAQGLCVSTAVVEAACKVVVGSRLKQSGMHWTTRGANAILALRCLHLSGRFEDFWERRSERRAAA